MRKVFLSKNWKVVNGSNEIEMTEEFKIAFENSLLKSCNYYYKYFF